MEVVPRHTSTPFRLFPAPLPLSIATTPAQNSIGNAETQSNHPGCDVR